MRILIVDDDPIVLDILKSELCREGQTEISTALSGAAALNVLDRSDEVFDLLILDIEMPEMDGISLCKRVRELQAYGSTPIIMLTAKSDAHSIERAFGAGATDYITKPFDLKDVEIRIQLAERITREAFKTFTLETSAKIHSEPYCINQFGIDDPIRISGLYQHTDIFSLGNYLSQLERKKVDETSVFAVQINAFDMLYSICPHDKLLMIIGAVNNAISFSVKNNRLLIAYAGAGKFVCIANDDVFSLWPEIEQRVDDHLQHSGSLRSAKLDASVSVIVGRPFRPNASKTQRVRPAFDRAYSILEKRLDLFEKERLEPSRGTVGQDRFEPGKLAS